MLETLAPSTPAKWRRMPPRPGMVWIRGGHFRMGSDGHYPEEGPARPVSVDGFWIDSTPVTNRQFDRFVRATGYVTTAERAIEEPSDRLPIELHEPTSLVFTPPNRRHQAVTPLDGWSFTPGADWRHPTGPQSNWMSMESHPVVHVSWEDVCTYAAWARMDLPTEAEWEFAARGGLDGATYAWGEELSPGGHHMANIWHGRFPFERRIDDGWIRTSPVGSYPADGHGLYDMIGNVWEWTRDWWSTRTGAISPVRCCSVKNRSGGCDNLSDDPALAHLKIPRRVIKGGSYLCAPNFCGRYRPAARQPMAVDTSACHVGFRCVVRSSMMR
jgi:formylglycine-generating enzyme required for sulfatase activity